MAQGSYFIDQEHITVTMDASLTGWGGPLSGPGDSENLVEVGVAAEYQLAGDESGPIGAQEIQTLSSEPPCTSHD